MCGVWRKGTTHTHTHTYVYIQVKREERIIDLCNDDACVYSKVWQIRVDVHMLNHDGNLMDAASVAAITALCHFRRPDVGIQGDEVTVVSQTNTQQLWSLLQ